MARSPIKAEYKSPLKSSLRQTPTPKSPKKTRNDSILIEPTQIYNTPSKIEHIEIPEASDLIPTELVLYVSALQVRKNSNGLNLSFRTNLIIPIFM